MPIEARAGGIGMTAEAQHDGLFSRIDRIEACCGPKAKRDDGDKGDYARTNLWTEPFPAIGTVVATAAAADEFFAAWVEVFPENRTWFGLEELPQDALNDPGPEMNA